MTSDEKLELLKELIDEATYPMFTDEQLERYIAKGGNLYDIATRLLYQKASIPEIRLGDVTIVPPSDYFYIMANSFRGTELDDKTGEAIKRKSTGVVMTRHDDRQ